MSITTAPGESLTNAGAVQHELVLCAAGEFHKGTEKRH
jgi:hypothetical protein